MPGNFTGPGWPRRPTLVGRGADRVKPSCETNDAGPRGGLSAAAAVGVWPEDRRRVPDPVRLQRRGRHEDLRHLAARRVLHHRRLRRDLLPGGGGLHPVLPGRGVPDRPLCVGQASACDPHEVCLESGWCAPRASELRRCLLRCKDSGDCRDEYECRPSGQHSSKAITTGRRPRSGSARRAPAGRAGDQAGGGGRPGGPAARPPFPSRGPGVPRAAGPARRRPPAPARRTG